MIIKAPKYYYDFKCVADRCTDTCCALWEIYPDERTKKLYATLTDGDGRKYSERINDESGSFIMNRGRCPFLTDNGLCEVIKKYGEECLCEICAEHPRFYNYLGDVTETGLGLSCPTAAQLILYGDGEITESSEYGESDTPPLDEIDRKKAAVITNIRESLFSTIKEENSISSVMATLIATGEAMDDAVFDGKFEEREIKLKKDKLLRDSSSEKSNTLRFFLDYLSEVEYLYTRNEENIFKRLSNSEYYEKSADYILLSLSDEENKAARRLMEYFLFRYLAPCLFTEDFSAATKFSVLSTLVIIGISRLSEDLTICYAAKEYSKQIEYNPETVDNVFSELNSSFDFSCGRFMSFLIK